MKCSARSTTMPYGDECQAWPSTGQGDGRVLTLACTVAALNCATAPRWMLRRYQSRYQYTPMVATINVNILGSQRPYVREDTTRLLGNLLVIPGGDITSALGIPLAFNSSFTIKPGTVILYQGGLRLDDRHARVLQNISGRRDAGAGLGVAGRVKQPVWQWCRHA